MDPNTTWDTFLQAYATKDIETAVEQAEHLLDWLARDGFPPSLTVGSTTFTLTCQLDADWNRAIATAACQYVIDNIRKENPHAAL